MSHKGCYQVIVKDERGRVVIDWTASLFFSKLTVKTEAGKTIVERKSWFGTQTYIPAMNESVRAISWLGHQFNRN